MQLPAARICRTAPAVLMLLLGGLGWPGPGGTPNAEAKRPSYTIHTSGGYISRIGPFRTSGRNGGTLGGAVGVFGAPSSVHSTGNGCDVLWRSLRFMAQFANFGIGDACNPTLGALQSASIRSSRFRTTRGVRVGSRSSTIPDKHHNAEFIDGSWWIASVVLPFGNEEETGTIRAIVRDGRVRALKLWVGAAGE